MTLLPMIAAIALLGSVTWAHAQTMSGADFAATAASSDMIEIRASELVLQNSKNAGYIKAQLAVHKEALALINFYAEGGESAALKAHAQKTAPGMGSI